ncbi:MAG: DUF2207 domain-containing protein [Acidimicrobiia bacterium]
MTEASDASPAVVDLLVHSGRLTGDALAATVVDLAARGWVHLEQAAPGQVLCRISHAPPARDGLDEHERMTMDLLHDRAVDGVVPTGALGQGITDEADRWWRRFTAAVMEQSDTCGLTKGPGWSTGFFLGAGVLFVWLALLAGVLTIENGDLRMIVATAWAAFTLWAASIPDTPGQRRTLTPEGIALGSRWITMREQVLDLLPDDLGPAAAAVRGRTLAFAAAVGTAPSVVRGLPRGPDSTDEAWVLRGGIWSHVRLRYPIRMPRGWGRPPLTTIVPGFVGVVIAAAVLWGTRHDIQPLLDGAALVLLVIAGSEWLAGVHDALTSPREVHGVVVARWLFNGSRWNPWRDAVAPRWFVVIDDGRSRSLRGLRVSEDAFHKAHRGDTATAHIGRAQGFVHDIEISHARRGRRG